MNEPIKVTISGHELELQKVIDALDSESVSEVLDGLDAEALARKLPTMVIVEELEQRPDIFQEFLRDLYWRTSVNGADMDEALRELASEHGTQWPPKAMVP